MIIPQKDNFCRVFELPIDYPKKYCFGGGHDITFKMVDWFNPLPLESNDEYDDMTLESFNKCLPKLKEFIKGKHYIKPGRQYLVITDFGEAFIV